jgi:hypothetical protein
LLLLWKARLSPLVLAAALAFVLACGQRFLIRPDILSFPLILVALHGVDRLPENPRAAWLVLTLLSVAWANLHGSCILVLALLVSSGAGALMTRPRTIGAHGVAILLFAVGVLMNPYTFRLYGLFAPYVRSILATTGMVSPAEYLGVAEWTPTWRVLASDPEFPRIPFFALVALLLLSGLRAGRAVSASRLMCATAMLVLGLTAVRNILPFGATALWTIVRNEEDRKRGARSNDAPGWVGVSGRWANAVVAVLVAALAGNTFWAVLTDRYYVNRDLPIVTGVGPSLDLVPERAVEWLATHETPGRLFNNYNSGAYLLYRLYPHVRNYIDSRFDVTPTYAEIQRALPDPETFEALVDRDGIGTILLLHPSPESVLLLPWLARDPRWSLAFRDANTTIHVRSAAPSPKLRSEPVALARAIEPAAERVNMWLTRFRRAEVPVDDLTDAFVSGILGDVERQREAYRRVLSRDPDNLQARQYFTMNP